MRIEQFVTWDSDFSITFFDKNFLEENRLNEFHLGSELYFEIKWKDHVKFKSTYPMEFYTEQCVITDFHSKSSFRVIEQDWIKNKTKDTKNIKNP